MIAAFDSLWSACPDIRTSIRIDSSFQTGNAICSGIGMMREASEQGLFKVASATVRLKASTENKSSPLNMDRVIEVRLPNNSEWVKMRIAGRTESAGILILALETLFE